MSSGALIPAMAAAGGGGALIAGIHIYEHERDARMRSGRIRHQLIFAHNTPEAAASAALAGLAGSSEAEFVFEVLADSSAINHALWIPQKQAGARSAQLSAALPGLRARAVDLDRSQRGLATASRRILIPARTLLRGENASVAARSLLASLARLGDDEQVAIRWAARPAPLKSPDREPSTSAERDLRRAMRKRAGDASFAASGLVLVKAASALRARSLLEGIGEAIRARSRMGAPPRLISQAGGRPFAAMPKTSLRGGRLTADELLGLLGWPTGEHPIEGVVLAGTRQLRLPRGVALSGRRLFMGVDRSGERPVFLEDSAQRLHEAIIGPTGSGKSTLIASGVLDDLRAGQGGLLVDPKDGSLISAVLQRVAPSDAERVVVLDPVAAGPVAGIDLFGYGDPDLRADVLTSTLRSIYAPQGAWGVRSSTYLTLALRTLAALERPNLLLLGRLFTDASFRHYAVSRLSDPVLASAWAAYEELSRPEQREHVAAPLNRVMGLLQRPALRAVLAQPEPRVSLERLWRSGGWLLVNLAPGSLGEEASRLLGAIVSFLAWSALESRSGTAPEQRPPTALVFDELQALSELPLSLERLAERARGFNGRLVLGTQSISRLPGSLADAVFANFATIVCFRAGARESERLARELPGLDARDVMSLAPYEVAARVASGHGTGVLTLTGRTLPLGRPNGHEDQIRANSAERYGVQRDELDRAVRELLSAPASSTDRPPAGRARRPR